MGNDVFANGREISCKAADGKAIAAFPDVCMTPPENPATPPGVPVPYPNTGMAKDATSGSKNVKISRKEVMLKNKSYFKKSMGNEAGSAAKKGVVTSVNRGKVYFTSWSMDVKFEGENVVRHMDMTTHNHASQGPNSVPTVYADGMAASAPKKTKPCDKESCPTEPDGSRKDELRKSTPTDELRKKVNKGSPKRCTACGQFAKTLHADHIVPLDIIIKMPGFACLPHDDQEDIANEESNFMGLCGSCNSSKKAKLWHRWKGVKSRGISWNPERIYGGDGSPGFGDITNELIVKLKSAVREKDCASGE